MSWYVEVNKLAERYLNMQANPVVSVQVGKEHHRAIAEEVPDEERESM